MDDFQTNGKLGKYAIELEIDSNEAFDYENPDNAKYTVDDLQTMLLKEIRSIEIWIKLGGKKMFQIIIIMKVFEL